MATARVLLYVIMSIAAAVFMIATMWKVNEKGGKPGWAAVVPIYNEVVLLQLAGKSGWWFLLYCIPLVNVVIYFIARIDLAKSFGRGVGFGLGLIFLPVIFFPILAWDDPEYIGPPGRTRAPV